MPTTPPGLHLVLASASPRRRGLLAAEGFSFRTRPVETAELGPREQRDPWTAAQLNAERKARAGVEALADAAAVVLAADTVLAVEAGWLGKPPTRAAGERMLIDLGGRVHQVVTGVALAAGDRFESLTATTAVRLRPLTLEQVRAYHAAVDPLDKAGAYDINQHGPLAGGVVESIEGSYSNVMGLPMEQVIPRLEALGVTRIAPPQPNR